MVPKKMKKKHGFTLIELMVTIVIASIVLLGLAGVMADAIKGYNNMYQRIHGNIINDAYVSRIRFDSICRKASGGTVALDASIPQLEIYYYSAPNLSGDADLAPDMFARFALNNSQLILTTGDIAGNTTPTPEVLASNVTELNFSADTSRKAQMVMTLDNTEESITVTCGSLRHN